MPEIKRLSCQLSVDGSSLTDYFDPESRDSPFAATSTLPGPTRSCYIQSNEGAGFTIDFTISNAFRKSHPEIAYLQAFVRLDGNQHQLPIFSTTHSLVIVPGVSVPERPGQIYPFRFAKRVITDDAKVSTPAADTRELGEIRVDLLRFGLKRWATTEEEARVFSPVSQTAAPGETEIPVHEKALKGKDVGHAVELGASKSIPTHLVQGELLDTVERPFMSFVFRYRSKHALQVLGLLRRTPSPAPPSEIGNLAALSKEDLMKEVLALRAQTTSTRIKREAGEDTSGRRSASTGTTAKRRKREVVTVDLTED